MNKLFFIVKLLILALIIDWFAILFIIFGPSLPQMEIGFWVILLIGALCIFTLARHLFRQCQPYLPSANGDFSKVGELFFFFVTTCGVIPFLLGLFFIKYLIFPFFISYLFIEKIISVI